MDYGLATLLSLHGTRYIYACGYWDEIMDHFFTAVDKIVAEATR